MLTTMPTGEQLAPAGPVLHRPARSAAARAAIGDVWSTEVPQWSRSTRVLPDAAVDLIVTAAGVRVAGPDTGPCVERLPPGQVVGLQLRPDAVDAVLGLPASGLRDTRPELADLWGDPGRVLVERIAEITTMSAAVALVEAAVAARLEGAEVGRAPVDGLRDQIAAHGRASPEAMGLSERQLRRRCLAAYGYGPKTLAKILRFQAVTDLIRADATTTLADVATRCGYADQAHLSHDVGEFSGLTPTALRTALTTG